MFRRRGRATVDHAEDGPSLAGLGHDHLDRVGGGTEDAADLGHLLHLVEYVHREPLPQKYQERVARSDGEHVAGGQLDELVIIA